MNFTNSFIQLEGDSNVNIYLLQWCTWWILPWVMIMRSVMTDNEGVMLQALFSCSCVSGQRWLGDIGRSCGADEEFSLSSQTQGYGSILLSTLFLFHHKLCFVSLFHLNLITSSVVVICLKLWGITAMCFCFPVCHLFSCSFPPHLSWSVFPFSHCRHFNEAAAVLIFQLMRKTCVMRTNIVLKYGESC